VAVDVPVALRPRQCPGLLQRLLAGVHIRVQPPAWYVIEMEEPGCPAIQKTNFEAAALTSGQLMFDDADRVGHDLVGRLGMGRRAGGSCGTIETSGERAGQPGGIADVRMFGRLAGRNGGDNKPGSFGQFSAKVGGSGFIVVTT
jgi:hypothetical protein